MVLPTARSHRRQPPRLKAVLFACRRLRTIPRPLLLLLLLPLSLLTFILASGLGRWSSHVPLLASTNLQEAAPLTRGLGAEEWKRNEDLTAEYVSTKLKYWLRNKPLNKPETPMYPASTTEQYLTFEIDKGGFNNIRMQLECMVHLAIATGRTLVLTTPEFWYLLKGDSNEIGHFFDVLSLAQVVPVISMSEYFRRQGLPSDDERLSQPDKMKEFLRNHEGAFCPKWDPGSEVLVLPDVEKASQRLMPPLEKFANGRKTLVYDAALQAHPTLHFRSDYEQNFRLLATPSTFFYFASLEQERYQHGVIRDHFHYIPRLFDVAGAIVHRLLLANGPFNSMHLRRNDFQFKDVWISMSEVADNIENLLSPQMPLFVATDVKVKEEFDDLRKKYSRVYFLSDFDDLLVGIDSNHFGMIDQIVCTAAERFVGTDLSTFSANIVRMRGFMEDDVAPDKLMYVNTDRNTGYTYVDGWRTFATWMELPNLPKWEGAFTWAREFFMSWMLD